MFSDRELLGIVEDVAADGWAETAAVAARIFPTEMSGGEDSERARHAMRCVAVRLAWMRRFGVVDKHPERLRTWGLTAEGVDFRRGAISKSLQQRLAGVGDNQVLALAAEVSRLYRQLDAPAAKLMSREWRYGTHPRRWEEGR